MNIFTADSRCMYPVACIQLKGKFEDFRLPKLDGEGRSAKPTVSVCSMKTVDMLSNEKFQIDAQSVL